MSDYEEEEEGFQPYSEGQGFAYLGEMRIRGRFVPDVVPRMAPLPPTAGAAKSKHRPSPRYRSPPSHRRPGLTPRETKEDEGNQVEVESLPSPTTQAQHRQAATLIQSQWRGYRERREWKQRRLKFRQRRHKGAYEVAMVL